MEEALLHTGHSHPNLVWIIVASILSFVLGTGAGVHITRLRSRFGTTSANSTE